MIISNKILFETPIAGRPLFKNQQDLVNAILNEPSTEYYTRQDDMLNYQRAQNRLKAYVSQLLSSTVIRNVTHDFEEALTKIIQQRINDEDLTKELVTKIVDELKSKKALNKKTELHNPLLEQLSVDFTNGKYISIITAKPLEVDAEIVDDGYSLRKFVFEDLIDTLTNPARQLKDYRFNFPVDSSGILFWNGINKLLIRHLKNTPDKKAFLKLIEDKLSTKFESNVDLFDQPTLPEFEIQKISQLILKKLRAECKIVVFTCDAPIFSLPLIVIDPAETKNAKIYAIIDTDYMDFNVYKFSSQEIVLWRLFVWDKIKSHAYCGKTVELEHIFG